MIEDYQRDESVHSGYHTSTVYDNSLLLIRYSVCRLTVMFAGGVSSLAFDLPFSAFSMSSPSFSRPFLLVFESTCLLVMVKSDIALAFAFAAPAANILVRVDWFDAVRLMPSISATRVVGPPATLTSLARD